jgi:hypothetical protein
MGNEIRKKERDGESKRKKDRKRNKERAEVAIERVKDECGKKDRKK